MSSFRTAYRCRHCGKVFRSLSAYSKDWFPTIYRYPMICRNCGAKDKPQDVSAKPKLFGLKGWELSRKFKEEE